MLPNPMCFLYSEIKLHCLPEVNSHTSHPHIHHIHSWPCSLLCSLPPCWWWLMNLRKKGNHSLLCRCDLGTVNHFVHYHSNSSRLCPSPAQAYEPTHTTNISIYCSDLQSSPNIGRKSHKLCHDITIGTCCSDIFLFYTHVHNWVKLFITLLWLDSEGISAPNSSSPYPNMYSNPFVSCWVLSSIFYNFHLASFSLSRFNLFECIFLGAPMYGIISLISLWDMLLFWKQLKLFHIFKLDFYILKFLNYYS